MCQAAYIVRIPVRADHVLIGVPVLALPALAIYKLLQLGDIRVIGCQLLQSGDVRRGVGVRVTGYLDLNRTHPPISVIRIGNLAHIIFTRLSTKHESTFLAGYRRHGYFRRFIRIPFDTIPLIYRFHATHRSVSG